MPSNAMGRLCTAMRRLFSILFLSVLVFAGAIRAQSYDPRHPPVEPLPPFVITGMNAYKSVGPEAAIKAWVEDSALAGSKDALDQAAYLRQTQDFYGKFQGYELITTRIITPRTRVYYLLLEYEKGPLFAKFVAYRVPQRWLLTSFDFNIREEMILPIGFTQNDLTPGRARERE